jgi:hypothetical protein
MDIERRTVQYTSEEKLSKQPPCGFLVFRKSCISKEQEVKNSSFFTPRINAQALFLVLTELSDL